MLGAITWHGMIIVQILCVPEMRKPLTKGFLCLRAIPYNCDSTWFRRVVFILSYGICTVLLILKPMGTLLTFTFFQLFFFSKNQYLLKLEEVQPLLGKKGKWKTVWFMPELKVLHKGICTMEGFETFIFHPIPPRVSMFKLTLKQMKLLSLPQCCCWAKERVAGMDCD